MAKRRLEGSHDKRSKQKPVKGVVAVWNTISQVCRGDQHLRQSLIPSPNGDGLQNKRSLRLLELDRDTWVDQMIKWPFSSSEARNRPSGEKAIE